MSMWQRVSMRRVEFGLLLLGALIMAVTVVNLELSQGNELSSSVLWVIGGYFGVFSIGPADVARRCPAQWPRPDHD